MSSRLRALAALLLAVAWVGPARAQVVVRERVEVRAAVSAAPVALDAAADCAGPVLGHDVYRPGSRPDDEFPTAIRTVGAPIAGSLTVETTCATHTADLAAGAYELASVTPYWLDRRLDQYNYVAADGAELLRVPLHRGEALVSATYTVGAMVHVETYGDGGGPVDVGFSLRAPRPCVGPCYATLAAHRALEGQAVGLSPAWPPEVACGSRTPLALVGTRADGSEGYVVPAVEVGGQFIPLTQPNPAPLPEHYGRLVADTASVGPGKQLKVEYGAWVSGGVSYEAPPCAVVEQPMEGLVWLFGYLGERPLIDWGGAGTIVVLPASGGAVDLVMDTDHDGDLDADDEAGEDADGRVGALVALNDDDDDESGEPDVGESGFEDDDIEEIRLVAAPVGEVRLEAVQGGENVWLWTNRRKTAEVVLPHTLPASALPVSYFVEGVRWDTLSTVLRLVQETEVRTEADTVRLYVGPTAVSFPVATTPGVRPVGSLLGFPAGTELTLTTVLDGAEGESQTVVMSGLVQLFEPALDPASLQPGATVAVRVGFDGGAGGVLSGDCEVVPGPPDRVVLSAPEPARPWVADGVSTRRLDVAVMDSLGFAVAEGTAVVLQARDHVGGAVDAPVAETDAEGTASFVLTAPISGGLTVQASAGSALSGTLRLVPVPVRLELVSWLDTLDVHHKHRGGLTLQTNAAEGAVVQWSVSNGEGGRPRYSEGQVYRGTASTSVPTEGADPGLSIVTASVGNAAVAKQLRFVSSAPLSAEVAFPLLAGDVTTDGTYSEVEVWDVPEALQPALGPTLERTVEGPYVARTPVTLRGQAETAYRVRLRDPADSVYVEVEGLAGDSLRTGPDGTATIYVRSTGALPPGRVQEVVELVAESTGPGAAAGPYASVDVGQPVTPGSVEVSGDVYYVTGGGSVGGTADAFRFVYGELPADGAVSAALYGPYGPDGSKAGVMVRASLDADAPHAFLALSDLGVRFEARLSAGAPTAQVAADVEAPLWLRLERAGTQVTASVSADGSAWTPLGAVDVPGLGAGPVHAGLAVAASGGGAGGVAQAFFSDVVVGGTPPAVSALDGPLTPRVLQTDAAPPDTTAFRVYLAPRGLLARWADRWVGQFGGDVSTEDGFRAYQESSRGAFVPGALFAVLKNDLRQSAKWVGWDRWWPEALQLDDPNYPEYAAQTMNLLLYYVLDVEVDDEEGGLFDLFELAEETVGLEALQRQMVYLASIGMFTRNSAFSQNLSLAWVDCMVSPLDLWEGCASDLTAYTAAVGERAGYTLYAGDVFGDEEALRRSMRLHKTPIGVAYADAVDTMVQDPARRGLLDWVGRHVLAVLDTVPELRADLVAAGEPAGRVVRLAHAVEDGHLDWDLWRRAFSAIGFVTEGAPEEVYTRAHLAEDAATITATFGSRGRAQRRRQQAFAALLRRFAQNGDPADFGTRYEIAGAAYLTRTVGGPNPDLRIREAFRSVRLSYRDESALGGVADTLASGDLDVVLNGLAYELKANPNWAPSSSTGQSEPLRQYRKDAAYARHEGLKGFRLSTPGERTDLHPRSQSALARLEGDYRGTMDFSIGYQRIPLNGRDD